VLKVRHVAMACALMTLAACGVTSASEATEEHRSTTVSPSAAAERATLTTSEDSRRSLGNGVTITISAPSSFTPTETAYPKTERAVAFQLLVENGGTIVYRPSRLTLAATVNGLPASQVIDSTQGYPGVSGVIGDVPPGEDVRFSVAFGIPRVKSAIRIEVLPDDAITEPLCVYDGTV
jgi:hypothetical protein